MFVNNVQVNAKSVKMKKTIVLFANIKIINMLEKLPAVIAYQVPELWGMIANHANPDFIILR